jgi:hypothetical protein
MKRLGLAVAVVAVALMVAPALAWGDDTIWATCTSGGQAQTCDSSAWYSGGLTVVWHASPTPDTTSGCALEVNYRYSTDQVTPVSCSATWSGPGPGTTTITEPYTLQVETSSPTATVAPSRPPDSNGWYNHAVTGAPSATAFSGIASCTSTSYAGPDTTSATVSTTCVDNAKNKVTATSAPFAYDATPPSLTATASTGDRTVALSWQTGGDIAPIAAISVVRSPGGAVYSGTASGYQDNNVQDGVRYSYTVTAVDAAGNSSSQTISATPQAALIAPVNSARLAGPPLLSWTPVRGASYYNVQLYRDGKTKVLSIWPIKAQLQLKRNWRYDGRMYRLKPGRYRWFVWPGFGKRRAARYGHAIGSWTFVVAR